MNKLNLKTINRLINNENKLASIELKVIKEFVQITYSCLEEAVHAGLTQRALNPLKFLKTKKACCNAGKRKYFNTIYLM